MATKDCNITTMDCDELDDNKSDFVLRSTLVINKVKSIRAIRKFSVERCFQNEGHKDKYTVTVTLKKECYDDPNFCEDCSDSFNESSDGCLIDEITDIKSESTDQLHVHIENNKTKRFYEYSFTHGELQTLIKNLEFGCNYTYFMFGQALYNHNTYYTLKQYKFICKENDENNLELTIDHIYGVRKSYTYVFLIPEKKQKSSMRIEKMLRDVMRQMYGPNGNEISEDSIDEEVGLNTGLLSVINDLYFTIKDLKNTIKDLEKHNQTLINTIRDLEDRVEKLEN